MFIPFEKESEALEILESIVEQVRFEAGCLGCRVYCGVEDPPSVMFEQLWASEDDVAGHLRSDIYRYVLLVVEMAREPPEVRFDAIAGTMTNESD